MTSNKWGVDVPAPRRPVPSWCYMCGSGHEYGQVCRDGWLRIIVRKVWVTQKPAAPDEPTEELIREKVLA